MYLNKKFGKTISLLGVLIFLNLVISLLSCFQYQRNTMDIMMADLSLSDVEELIIPAESDTHASSTEIWLVGRLLPDRSVNFGVGCWHLAPSQRGPHLRNREPTVFITVFPRFRSGSDLGRGGGRLGPLITTSLSYIDCNQGKYRHEFHTILFRCGTKSMTYVWVHLWIYW